MTDRDKRQWEAIKSDPVRYAAYLERKRRERKARPDYERERKAKWRAKNAERNRILRKAHHAVEAALLSGKIVRPAKCERCHRRKPTGSHHKSYARADWLKVEWLCDFCHPIADAERSCDES